MNWTFWKHTIISESLLQPWTLRVITVTWLGRLGAQLVYPLEKRKPKKPKRRLIKAALPLRSGPDLTSGRAYPENTHGGQGSCWTSVKTQRLQQRKMGKVRSYLRSCYKPSKRHLFDQTGPADLYINVKASILTCCYSHFNKDSQLSPKERKQTASSASPGRIRL